MNKITKITRRNILTSLPAVAERVVVNFFSLEEYPSYDSRYETMEGDYMQHREANLDWEDDWFIDDLRLNIMDLPDEEFLGLCKHFLLLENNSNTKEGRKTLLILNEKLLADGFEIVQKPNGEFVGQKIPFLTKESSRIKFYSVLPIETINEPFFYLKKSSWDDFGYKTTFELYFYKTSKASAKHICELKIAHIINEEDQRNTILPDDFYQLDKNIYFSALSSKDAYIDIRKNETVGHLAGNIMQALNDIVINREINKKFQRFKVFYSSLLRQSDIAFLLEEKNYTFSFSNDFFGEINQIHFNFNEDPYVPFRIMALIGENGAGKTTLLRNLTKSLIQYSSNSELLSIRPNFSKVISISYSLFDSAPPPDPSQMDLDIDFSYCSLWEDIKSDNILLSMENKFISLFETIQSKDDFNMWNFIIKDFFGDKVSTSNIQDEYKKLSSGQKILVTIFTELFSQIEPQSLIIFDEPETHLHPSLIFKLINSLNRILDYYDSYSIVATHSPIIIQQIPSRNVIVLVDGYPTFLRMESFGENFSVITREIFGNYETDDISYKSLFKDLISKGYTAESIHGAFGNSLNLNARIYLENLNKNDLGRR